MLQILPFAFNHDGYWHHLPNGKIFIFRVSKGERETKTGAERGRDGETEK